MSFIFQSNISPDMGPKSEKHMIEQMLFGFFSLVGIANPALKTDVYYTYVYYDDESSITYFSYLAVLYNANIYKMVTS